MSGSARQGLRVLLVAWWVAGAVLLVAVLTKGDVEGLAGRVGASAAVTILLSLVVAAGVRLARRVDVVGLFGAVTVMVAAATFFIVAVEVWSDPPGRDESRVAVMLVLSLLLGAGSVLLYTARDEESGAVRAARAGAILALTAIGVLVVLAVSDVEVSARLAAFVAAAFLVPALSLPVLRLLDEDGGRSLALDHAVIAVSDPGRSERFYSEVLGARVEAGPEGRVAYRIGKQRLNVHHPNRLAAPLAATPVAPGNSDLCFVWPGRASEAVTHLRARGVAIVEGPVLREGAHGLGVSVYCRDPDGSLIELISYR
ncbi:MAG TPA: VOC family protein [Solirubrobacterales bacterium]|nr:VOC family protein [Solirubrobacterales bacterium]